MKKASVLLLIIVSLIATSFAGIAAPGAKALSAPTVMLSTYQAGAAATYTIEFTTTSILPQGKWIMVTFPLGTTVPNGNFPPSLVTVNSANVALATGSAGSSTVRPTLTVNVQSPVAAGSVTVRIDAGAGIRNPVTPAAGYRLSVSTEAEPTPVESSAYQIVPAISNVSVSVDPPTAGSVAAYTVTFNAGSAITPRSSINLGFPSGTTVPTSYPVNSVYVMGSPAFAYGTGQTMVIYVPDTVSVLPGGPVVIQITAQANVKNPPVPGNTYKLSVSTNTDTTPVQSSQYQITGTSVANLVVAADPKAQSAPTEITLTFVTSPTGALAAGSGTIRVDFPDGMTVPSSVPSGQVTVNGTPAYYVSVGSGGVVTITTPVAIAAYQQVSIVFRKNVGILNPASSGTVVSIAVSTSADMVPVSGSYITITSQIAQPQVQLTSNGAGSTSGYTVTFTTGAVGSLRAGYDRISLVFPSGTVVPATITKDRVTVNGYAAHAVSVSGNRLDITPSMNVTAGGSVQVVISKDAGIKNPVVATVYTLQAYTSVETTPVTSASYTIVNLPKTIMVVSPAAPDGLNGYYKTRPTVVLSASSATDPSPVVYYTINGGAQQVYTAPIQLPDGTVTLSYFARDRQGNQEDAQTATFKVDATAPTATITSPVDGSTVAQSPVTITGKVSPGMQVRVGSQTATVSPTGDFTVSVPLVEGAQTIALTITSVSGNVGQAQLRLTLDTKPPVLTITEPKIYATVMTQQITVSGKTEAGATVTVAGSPVSVGADGSFSVKYMFTKEGLNVIEITATDPAGNGAKAAIPVTYIARTVIRLQVGNKTAMVNDASKTLQAAPVNVKGVVNVPLRFIGEAFGATVEWEPVFKIVRIQLGTTTIYLQVGSNYASVNGKKVVLQGVPTIVSGTTMVPIRFISEAFGAEVVWTEATKGITITYPKP